MRGDVNMDSHKITNLLNPTTNGEPVTKGYADTNYRGLTSHGFTMKGNISMGGDKITNLYKTTGPKGDKGDAGPQGPKGDAGDFSGDIDMMGHN